MERMFYEASVFNSDVSQWVTSKVDVAPLHLPSLFSHLPWDCYWSPPPPRLVNPTRTHKNTKHTQSPAFIPPWALFLTGDRWGV